MGLEDGLHRTLTAKKTPNYPRDRPGSPDPAAPLPSGGLYEIVINGPANPAFGTGLTDTAGNLLDGTHSGHAGGAYVDVFGTGKFAVASIPVPVHRTHTTPRGHLPTIRPVFHRARPRH